MHCPDEERLVVFFGGQLQEAELAAIEAHLTGCRDCANALMLLAQLVDAPTKHPSEDAAPGDDGLAAAPPARIDVGVGSVLGGRYRLVREIGHGAMGIVFEAEHTRLASRHAVKLLSPTASSASKALERFEREARLTSALQHPNVVSLFDFDQTPSGRAYVAMEYLDGPDLSAYCAPGRTLSPEVVLDLVSQIAAGLQAVHRRGMVHRDLKPQNVIAVKDESSRLVPKIVDFGLAKVIEGALDVTDQPMLLGTPRYMAPEQVLARPDEIGPATDQFALAAITYELLVGAPLFRGASMLALTHEIVNARPATLAALGVPAPPHWDAVLARALAKEPSARFPSVEAFAAALAQEPASGFEARRPWSGRRAGTLAAVAVAVVALAGGALRVASRRPPRSPTPRVPSITASAVTAVKPPPAGPPPDSGRASQAGPPSIAAVRIRRAPSTRKATAPAPAAAEPEAPPPETTAEPAAPLPSASPAPIATPEPQPPPATDESPSFPPPRRTLW